MTDAPLFPVQLIEQPEESSSQPQKDETGNEYVPGVMTNQLLFGHSL